MKQLPTQKEFEEWQNNKEVKRYKTRDAVKKSKELGRPLTDKEMEEFLIDEKECGDNMKYEDIHTMDLEFELLEFLKERISRYLESMKILREHFKDEYPLEHEEEEFIIINQILNKINYLENEWEDRVDYDYKNVGKDMFLLQERLRDEYIKNIYNEMLDLLKQIIGGIWI